MVVKRHNKIHTGYSHCSLCIFSIGVTVIRNVSVKAKHTAVRIVIVYASLDKMDGECIPVGNTAIPSKNKYIDTKYKE